MTFEPTINQRIEIGGNTYRFAEHPGASWMAYQQEGRRAEVWQLVGEDNSKYALKVFFPKFRDASMVSVAEKLEPYAALPGLEACKRTVLTSFHHLELIQKHADLVYAVLMPWLDGYTWMEQMSGEEMAAENSLALGRSFARMMTALEVKRLAHCDLSGPNVIIRPGEQPGLVDLEEMYGPDFLKPDILSAGSPGYAHQTARHGLWSKEADRFAGAVMLAEMLCWCDPAVRKASWDESYFDPNEMQKENNRVEILRTALKTLYGDRVLRLFNRAWNSDSLRDCPTFGEWTAALPEKVREFDEEEKEPGHPGGGPDIPDPPEPPPENEPDEDKLPARPCPDCGKEIPEGQNVCPYCEGMGQPDNPRRKSWAIWLGVGSISVILLIMFLISLIADKSLAEPTVTFSSTKATILVIDQSMTVTPQNPPQPTSTAMDDSLTILDGHTSGIDNVIWSPDGKKVVSISDQENAIIWDVINGEQLYSIDGPVKSVAWSPSGDQLAIGTVGESSLLLWNDGCRDNCLRSLEEYNDWVIDISWSPDGRYLACASKYATITIWDVQKEEIIRTLTGHTHPVGYTGWSPDGSQITSLAGEGIVITWNVENGHQIQSFRPIINNIIWSPDGQKFSGESDDSVVIWDGVTGERIITLLSSENIGYLVSWSPDGSKIANSSEENIIIWDIVSGEQTHSLDGFSGWANILSWSPDGSKIAAGGNYLGVVTIWDIEKEIEQMSISLEGEYNDWRNELYLLWSPDGRRLAYLWRGINSGEIRDMESGEVLHILNEEYKGALTGGAWSPDGSMFSGWGEDGAVIIWEFAEHQ